MRFTLKMPSMTSVVAGTTATCNLPIGRRFHELLLAYAGITLAPPGALQQVDRGTLGVRLCLGHPPTETELEKAMTDIRRILDMTETISFV